MRKTVTIAFLLATGLVSMARAALPPVELPHADGSIITVGEGCGPNRWRGPHGHCHWFDGPGGSYRGTPIECPPGWHIGAGRHACWPN